MGLLGFQMITRQNLGFLCFERWRLGFVFRVVFGLWVWFVLSWPVTGVRPIRERARSWGDEVGIYIHFNIIISFFFLFSGRALLGEMFR